MGFEANIEGLDNLRRAVDRNPDKVLSEISKFLVRGLAIYRSTILNNPWRIGMTGGGAPRATGNLAATHQQEIGTWEGRIFPTAPYAKYVHGVEGYERKRLYQLRPWLDYTKATNDREITRMEGDLLDNIVDNLAS